MSKISKLINFPPSIVKEVEKYQKKYSIEHFTQAIILLVKQALEQDKKI